MMAPNRRVSGYTLGPPRIGTDKRAALLELSCGHELGISLVPLGYAGPVVVPDVVPCILCPEVPDGRADAFLDGARIPALSVAR